MEYLWSSYGATPEQHRSNTGDRQEQVPVAA
jgi:hypothetical protein